MASTSAMASVRKGKLKSAIGSVIESLEKRQLLASVAINFQTSSTSTPSGYLADSGATYANRGNGYSYGWNTDNSANTANEGAIIMVDTPYKSYAKMQPGGVNRTWEIGLTNGQYQVKVVAGDYENPTSDYDIRVEGTQGPLGNADAYTHWFEKTVVVNVTDGRLTLTNGSGASDQRISFVQINDVASLSAPTTAVTNLTARAASNTAVDLIWDDTTSNEYGFVIQRKPIGGTYSTIATVGGGNEYWGISSRAFYTDTGLTGGQSYSYRVRPVNAATVAEVWSIDATVAVPATNAQAPYNGTARSVTSRIEAEDFDIGGPAFGYADASTGNYADLYRKTDVDVGMTSAGYFVGWNNANEWTAYTVTVPTTGTYDLTFSRSRTGNGGTFEIYQDGTPVGPDSPIQILDSGGAFTFATTTVSGFNLTQGTHVLKLKIVSTPSGSGECGNIDWLQFNLVSAGVAAPTGLAAPTVQPNSVSLTWTDNASGETSYRVERKVGMGAWSTLASGLNANSASYTDSTVSANTSYTYRVVAVGATDSPASNEVSITTPTDQVQQTLAPVADAYVRSGQDYQNLNYGSATEILAKLASSIYHRETFLKFDISGLTDVSSAKLRLYGRRNSVVGTDPNPLNFNIRSVSNTSWTESGLTYINRPSTLSTLGTVGVTLMTHQWFEVDITSFVQAERTAGHNLISLGIVGTYSGSDAAFYVNTKETSNGPELVVLTPRILNLPAAPSGLQLNGVIMPNGPATASVPISWIDNATNETGYRVERKAATGSWETIGSSLAANSTTYTDSNAATDETYEYRVCAINVDGDSAYATLTGIATPPTAPTDLAGSASPTAVDISWTDQSDTESEYRVEYRRSIDPTDPTYHTVSSAQGLGPNSTSYSLTGLLEGTQYDIRIRAINAVNDGWPAGPVQLWMKLHQPTELGITFPSSTSAEIAWTDQSLAETGYEIDVSANGTFPAGGTDTRTYPARAGSGATTQLIDDLRPGIMYYFRARAVKVDAGTGQPLTTSEYSPTISGALPVEAIVGLPAVGITGQPFEIVSLSSGTSPLGSTWSIDWGDGSPSSSWVDGQSLPTHTYASVDEYAVEARLTTSGGALAAIGTATATIEAPTNLGLGDLSYITPRAIVIWWEDASDNEAEFVIRRKSPGDTQFSDYYRAPSGDGAMAARFEGLEPGTTYEFIIVAITSEGIESAASNVFSVTTADLPTVVALPHFPSAGETIYLEAELGEHLPAGVIDFEWELSLDGVSVDLLPEEAMLSELLIDPAEAGTYGYTLHVRYGDGEIESVSGNIVVHGAPPSVTLDGSPVAAVNSPFELSILTAASSVASIQNYLVDWGDYTDPDGDGQVGELINSGISDITTISHQYSAAGNYVIHLAATTLTGTVYAPTLPVQIGNVPTAPTNTSVAASGVASVTVSWQPSADTIRGYVIECRVDGGDWEEADTVFADTTSYVDNAFRMNASLEYRVYSFNEFGSSLPTNTASIATGNGGLVAPSGVSAVAIDNERVSVTWTDNASTETGYLVEADSGNGFDEVAVAPANAQSYLSTGLIDGTSYTFRITAVSAFGASIAATASTITPMCAPVDLISRADVGQRFRLDWGTESLRNSQQFEVSYRIEDGAWSQPAVVSTQYWNSEASVLREANTSYGFRVRSVNGSNHSDWIEHIDIAANRPLQVQALSSGVRWEAAAGRDVLIERSLNGGRFQAASTVSGATGSWVDPGVEGATFYEYRLRFVGESGPSLWSYSQQFSRLPQYPTSLSVVAYTHSSVSLAWTGTLSGDDKYVVLMSADGGDAIPVSETVGTSLTLENLTANTTYLFSVYTRNAAGVSSMRSVWKRPVGDFLMEPVWYGASAEDVEWKFFDPSQAATATITGVPAAGLTAGTSVKLSASIPFAGYSAGHVVWDVSRDGSPYASGGGSTFEFVAESAGVYVATVRVYSASELLCSDSVTWTTLPNGVYEPNLLPSPPVRLLADANNDGLLDREKGLNGTDLLAGGSTSALVQYSFDHDANGVPDFAQGIGWASPEGGDPGPLMLSPLAFGLERPMPSWTYEYAEVQRVKFQYSGSDPTTISRSGSGTGQDPHVYSLAANSGSLRIWAVPETFWAAERLPFYVRPDVYYSLSELAGMKLYVQAVRPFELETVRVVAKGPENQGGLETHDEVRVSTVAAIDLDIDSDNTSTPASSPSRSAAQEIIENSTKLPGKIIVVNDGDLDSDGTVDFADGFDLDSAIPADDTAVGTFTPIVLQIPLVGDLTQSVLEIQYDASDPRKVSLIDSTSASADAGALRLWSADKSTARSGLDVRTAAGGDFVGPGIYYGDSLQRLLSNRNAETGEITLYVEGVRSVQSTKISVGWAGQWDHIRLTVVQPVTPEARQIGINNDGTVIYESRDFDLPGWTGNLGMGRLYNTAPEHVLTTGENGASVADWPQLINAGSSVIAFIGATPYFFDRAGDIWKSRFGGLQRLAEDASNRFRLSLGSGETWVFNNFGESLPVTQRGQFRQYISAGGQTVDVTDWTSTGEIEEITGGPIVLNYEYETGGESEGELRQVTATVNGIALHRAEYTYYSSSPSDIGGPHDIDIVTISKHDENATGGFAEVNKKKHFYGSLTAPDGTSPLIMTIEGEDRQRAIAAGEEVDAISTGLQLARAGYVTSFPNGAMVYTRQDGWARRGGKINTNAASGPNAWTRSQTVTERESYWIYAPEPDRTVYTNIAGQPLLVEVFDPRTSERMLTHYKYDSQWRLIMVSSSAAVEGYDVDFFGLVGVDITDNASMIRDYVGLVTHYKYNAQGLLEEISISQGELGGKTKLHAFEYAQYGVDQVWLENKATSFVTTSGSVSRSTTTDYQTIVHNLPTKVETTRPDGLKTTSEYNAFGRLERFTDADGYPTRTIWDNVKGVATSVTVDDRETTGALRLKTEVVTDEFGRPKTVTDASGRVTSHNYSETPELRRVTTTMPDGTIQETSEYLKLQFRQTLVRATVNGVTNIVAATREYLDVAGRVIHQDRYFNIPDGDPGALVWGSQSVNSLSGNYHRTSFVYDLQGRLTKTTDGSGTERETQFDGFGRVVGELVAGETVRSYRPRVDAATGTSFVITTSYPGNGKNRYSTDYFDWRGRPIATENGVQLIWRTFNNLDEKNLEEVFDNSKNRVYGVGSGALSGVQVKAYPNTGRVAQTSTDYNPLGLPNRIEQHTVTSDGTVSGGLVTSVLYDGRGNSKFVITPTGSVTTTLYDGAGRLYHRSLAAGGQTIEATNFTLNADGNPRIIESVQRNTRDQSELKQYTALWYDSAGRLTDRAEYGLASPPEDAGQPTSTVPDRSNTVLVNSYHYRADGRVDIATDPRNTPTFFEYDALGRQINRIENAIDANAWGTQRRQTVTSYNALNQPLTIRVRNQVPGVTSENDLEHTKLQKTSFQYTDPQAGTQPTVVSYPGGLSETNTYNNLSELVAKVDRNGVSHQYQYDSIGRQVYDQITNFGPNAATIDQLFKKISFDFDVLGRLVAARSEGGTNGKWGTFNEVRREYDGLGHLLKEWQSQDGPANVTLTPNVTYSYGPASEGGQLRSAQYIDGRKVQYDYGSPLDLALARPTALQLRPSATGEFAVIESYTYLGLNTVLSRTRPAAGQPDMQLDTDIFGSPSAIAWRDGTQSPKVNESITYLRFGGASIWQDAVGGITTTDTFDLLGHLKTSDRAVWNVAAGSEGQALVSHAALTWQNDSQGNRRGEGKYSTTYDDLNRSSVFVPDGSSAIPADHAQHIRFDNTPNAVFGLKFDGWGRLRSVSGLDWESSEGSYLFEYDALGRRIQAFKTNGTQTTYSIAYFDGSSVIREVGLESNGEYLWSPDGKLILRDKSGDPSEGGGRRYALHGLDGSTVAITDETGAVRERYLYDVDGKATAVTVDYKGYASFAAGNGLKDKYSTRQGWRVLYQGQFLTPLMYERTNNSLFANAGINFDHGSGVWTDGTLGHRLTPDPAALRAGLPAYDAGMGSFLNSAGALYLAASEVTWTDVGHIALDVAGMIPVIGGVFDAANAAWYYSQDDYLNGTFSAFAAVPGLGDLGMLAKWSWRGIETPVTALKLHRTLRLAEVGSNFAQSGYGYYQGLSSGNYVQAGLSAVGFGLNVGFAVSAPRTFQLPTSPAVGRFGQLRSAARFLKDEAGVAGFGERAVKYRRQVIESFGPDIRVGVFEGQAYQYSNLTITPTSRYLAPSPLRNPIREMALPPGNPAVMLHQYRVAPTRALMGSVAPQQYPGVPWLSGGGQQVFVPSRSVLTPTPLLPGP